MTVTSFGTISSPGSPGNYPPDRDCHWILSALPGKRIQFQFFTMQLEYHETCQYDFLAVYDGASTDSSLLEKFCNTSHPAPLTTTSNEATLHFHSDEAGTDAGFQIHYSVVDGKIVLFINYKILKFVFLVFQVFLDVVAHLLTIVVKLQHPCLMVYIGIM